MIVTAVMGAADFLWADRLRRTYFPPERNALPAHISLFRHLPPSLEHELKAELARLARSARPPAHIEGIMPLAQGVGIAIRSAGLLDIWSQLARRFTGMLMPLDQAEPRFHITVQNKVSPIVAGATRRALEEAVTLRPLAIQGLACWRYAGGPWTPVAAYSFRG